MIARVRLSTQVESDDDVLDVAAINDCIDDFKGGWTRTIEGILTAGRALIKAKELVRHGRWEIVVTERFGIQERTAKRLMRIARDEVLGNPSHVTLLPRGLSTLDRLVSAGPEANLEAIKSGRINPDMTREDAEEYLKEVRTRDIFAYGQIPAAVKMLLKYKERYDHSEEFAAKIVNYVKEAGLDIDSFYDASEWLAELADELKNADDGDEEDVEIDELSEAAKIKRVELRAAADKDR